MAFDKQQDHKHWGRVANYAALPNVSSDQTPDVHLGDEAFVLDEVLPYFCTKIDFPAEWAPIGGASVWEAYADAASDYSYVQADTVVDEVIGQLVFDGGQVADGLKAVFRSVITPDFTVPGTATVSLWDLGPSGGPPEVPRLVATLVTSTDGVQYISQDLTVVSSSPSGNEILDSARLYELTIAQTSVPEDTVYVGSAGINIQVS